MRDNQVTLVVHYFLRLIVDSRYDMLALESGNQYSIPPIGNHSRWEPHTLNYIGRIYKYWKLQYHK
jgi:hypothetical protein